MSQLKGMAFLNEKMRLNADPKCLYTQGAFNTIPNIDLGLPGLAATKQRLGASLLRRFGRECIYVIGKSIFISTLLDAAHVPLMPDGSSAGILY